MPNNTLYNFLQCGVYLPKGVRLVHAKTQRDQNYCRLDLENTAGITFIDDKVTFTLIEHHMSVYEFEDSSIAELSQYHYTAYFSDAEGAHYQLHVYYDDNDRLTTDPVFTKIGAEGSHSPMAWDGLYSQCLYLADSRTKPLISDIRVQFKQHIEQLSNAYKALEKEASSIMTVEPLDHRLYCSKLDRASGVLEQLFPLVHHLRYQKYHQLLQQIKKIVEQDGLIPKEPLDIGSDRSVFVSLPDASAEALAGSIVTQRISKPIMLDSDIAALNVNFAKIPTEKEDEYLQRLVKTLNTIYELSLQLQEPGYLASSAAMIQLQQVHIRLIEHIEGLYPKLMIAEKFGLLEALRAFDYLISARYLNLALQTGNPRLLDYLLRYGDFDLNTHSVEVRKTVYPNAILFCYQTMNTDCFSVLIKHNASVLIPGPDGLPLIHTILSTPDHPFKAALYASSSMSDKVVDSIPMYKQLIAILSHYIKNPGLDPAVCEKISADISTYSRRIDGLRLISSSASGSALKSAVSDMAQTHESSLFIQRLKTNPLYMGLIELLMQQCDRYVAMLSKQDRRAHERESTSYVNSLSKALSGMDTSILTFDIVLQQSCDYIKKCIALTSKKIRLIEVQKEIKKLHGSIHSMNRNAKAKFNEQERLINEIKNTVLDISFGTGSRRVVADDLEDLGAVFQEMQRAFSMAFSALELAVPECEKSDAKRSPSP